MVVLARENPLVVMAFETELEATNWIMAEGEGHRKKYSWVMYLIDKKGAHYNGSFQKAFGSEYYEWKYL